MFYGKYNTFHSDNQHYSLQMNENNLLCMITC